jgi:hypothetical protein
MSRFVWRLCFINSTIITTHSRAKTIGTLMNHITLVVSIVSLMFFFRSPLRSQSHVWYRHSRVWSWRNFWCLGRVHVLCGYLLRERHSTSHTITFWEPRGRHRRRHHRWYRNNLHRRCCNPTTEALTLAGGIRRHWCIPANAKRWDGHDGDAAVTRATVNNEVLCTCFHVPRRCDYVPSGVIFLLFPYT